MSMYLCRLRKTLSVDSPALRPSTLSLRTTSADAGPSTSRDHLDRLFVYPENVQPKSPFSYLQASHRRRRKPIPSVHSRFHHFSTTRKPYPSPAGSSPQTRGTALFLYSRLRLHRSFIQKTFQLFTPSGAYSSRDPHQKTSTFSTSSKR